MISEKTDLYKISKLTRKGYTIPKNKIHPNLYQEIRESLKVKPFTHKDYAKFAEEFYVFSENSSKLYLPKFWAIDNLGQPNNINITEGSKISINCKFQPLPFQIPIIDKIYNILLTQNGSILSVPCGFGKTFCSLYIACKLGLKTLVVVHTSVLLSQWIERIEQFVPDARIGIIRGAKFEVEDKDICIAMLQTLVSPGRKFSKDAFQDFGFLTIDEVHHMAAPGFSRALPLISTKYTLGLSATPNRQDKLEKVFKWYLGDIGWFQKKRSGFLITKYIKYTDDSFKEIRRPWNNSYNLPEMIKLIINSKPRNEFIVHQAISLAQTGRQILLLSARINHLKLLKKMINHFKKHDPIIDLIKLKFPYMDTIQNKIISYYKKPITCGLYIGGLKKHELDKSAQCNIILGSYSLVSEGTDIPTLNTLIMASPKKSIQQVVGRILRADTGFTPLVLDICDDFSIYTNQGYNRIKFYKMQEYHIDTFTKHQNENLKYKDQDIYINDTKQTEGYKKPKKSKTEPKKKRSKKKEKKVETKCLMHFSDSDN